MRLETVFSKQEYEDCLNKINRLEEFCFEFKKKKYKFIFEGRGCDNGLWKNNYMVSFGVDYGTGGFSRSMQIDKIDSYEKICSAVNEFWNRSEEL